MAPAEHPQPGRVLATSQESVQEPVPVPKEELNSWRRGFTPQAELWNGRLAMLGLSIGLTVLLLGRLLG